MPKRIYYFFGLLIAFVVFFAFATDLPNRQRGGFKSDESTYFSMVQSLAFDGDIRYTRNDIVRIRERFWLGPTGFFLKKGRDGGLYYAKSYVYPLLAAPFFRLFDVHGILLCNGLMLVAVLWMAWLLLSCHHPPEKSLLFALIFLFASVTWIYIWWITADLFNFFIVFAGMFFFFYPFRRHTWLFYLSGFCFAAAAFSKITCIVPAGIVMLSLLARRQWKRFFLLSLATGCGLALFFAGNIAATGQWNFMGGERRSFTATDQVGYPYERPEYTFETGFPMSADTYWQRFHLSPAVASLNAFYYFFGRFTGMFIYFFPAVFFLALFFLQKKQREDWFILTAIAAGILLYILLFDPENYFGGSGSLGNRYFFTLYPLFFFLGHRDRLLRLPAVPIAVAVVFLAPVFLDGQYYSAQARTAGVHFPVNLFPPEKTQYLALPSNENPRAFYRSVGEKFWLFFLNDNYNNLEGETFWTLGDRSSELFLLTPQRVRTLRVEFANHPIPNRVTVTVEGARQRADLAAEGSAVVSFPAPSGLKVSKGYIYFIRIRASRSYTPYFREKSSEDRRMLGVRTRFLPEY